MKTTIFIVSTLTGLLLAGAANAQKYKTLADTADLNKEYRNTTDDIKELNGKLTSAKGKVADYQDKTAEAQKDAQNAAQDSKEQAAKAADVDIKDIKKELKKAKKANNEANDAKDAASDEKANEKEIKYLNTQIEKKQKKLADLDKMRNAILTPGS